VSDHDLLFAEQGGLRAAAAAARQRALIGQCIFANLGDQRLLPGVVDDRKRRR
jgi:hypothetical protein